MDSKIVFWRANATKPAMEIREKMRQQFYFDFCHRKGQTRLHYDGKNFRQKFITSGSIFTMQRCIINNISKNNH